jgi:hypothetical protein
MYWRNRFDVNGGTRRAPTDPGGCRRSFAMAVLVAWIASGPAASAQEAGHVPAAGVPDAAARQVAAQMADLGTPAFVDGLAGLLVLHAGRDREIAGAIGQRVLTSAPTAGGQVARALRLAGFDPAVAGLDGAEAAPDAAAQSPTALKVGARGLGVRGFGAPGGRLAGTPDRASASQAAGRGRAVAPGATVRGLAPFGGSGGATGARGTARPGPGDLGTPQLR